RWRGRSSTSRLPRRRSFPPARRNGKRHGLHPPRLFRKLRCSGGGNRPEERARKRQWRRSNAFKVARYYVQETLRKEMAGYSKTPLAQKLGIKPGTKVAALNAPAAYRKLLAPLPGGVSFTGKTINGSGFVHLFATERGVLEKEL